MRALLLEVPQSLLDERRRTGADLWDEVWDGLRHMLPPPTRWHQRFGMKLGVVLNTVAERRGLEASYETSIYRPGTGERDYRTPDLIVYEARFGTQRGVEGAAELVVEILSPGDESLEKLPFYAQVGVRHVLVVNPETRAIELFVPENVVPKKLSPNTDGSLCIASLELTFTPIPGPKLRLGWPGGTTEI